MPVTPTRISEAQAIMMIMTRPGIAASHGAESLLTRDSDSEAGPDARTAGARAGALPRRRGVSVEPASASESPGRRRPLPGRLGRGRR